MKSYPLFSAYGVELEYMIVHRQTLEVLPITDRLIERVTGYITNEVIGTDISWSNELVLHVVELKTSLPSPDLDSLPEKFSQSVAAINVLLEEDDAMLLPTAMHPLMLPDRDMHLWPHGNREIYAIYDTIFNCKGHGWANLQSVHLNLPFSSKGEFARLHTAIRLILPLIPALSASSPIREGRFTGLQDTRLDVYKGNQAAIPQIAGRVIPEPVVSPEEYENVILQPMYKAVAPHDPEGILQEEWLNSRGAIARFDRNAIEIRVIDIQECPAADIAILQLICKVLQKLTSEELSPFAAQFGQETEPLAAILDTVIKDGDQAKIVNTEYLQALGLAPVPAKAVQVWAALVEKVSLPTASRDVVEVILKHGPLSRRIAAALGPDPGEEEIKELYSQLAVCLRENEMFIPCLV